MTVKLGETLKTLIFPFTSVNPYNPGHPMNLSEKLIEFFGAIFAGIKLEGSQEEFEKNINEYNYLIVNLDENTIRVSTQKGEDMCRGIVPPCTSLSWNDYSKLSKG